MKKAFILIALSAAFAGSVKAQDQSLKKFRLPTFATPPSFDIKADTSVGALKSNLQIKEQGIKEALAKQPQANTINKSYDAVFYSTMPIAGKQSNNSNTPIAKLGNSDTKYTMLVKRIDIMDIVKKTKTIDAGIAR